MINQAKICIVLASSLPNQCEKADKLSEDLALPISYSFDNPYEYHLVYTDFRLELQHNPYRTNKRQNSVYVDFLHQDTIHRRITSANKKNPLPRAAGVKTGIRPSIIDVTAGYGTDSMVLAWFGCKVTLIERSPVIHALLLDGIERAKKNEILSGIITSNISLIQGDSNIILQRKSCAADTIIVDPMYPANVKGPLNKKEMRIIRDIVGDDADNEKLLHISLQTAGKRVAVKRPKGAKSLSAHPKPTYVVPMKSGRFDVYLIDHL